MSDKFLADKPVNEKIEDRFQRFGFSKSVAQTILSRDTNDSLVIGIYGAWGEGKTSVLNFIEKEVTVHDKVIVIKFNPWRYTDEDTLLRNFLKKVATELDRELKKRAEKIADFVGKFGSVTSIFGVDFSTVGKVLADVDLEELKNRVDEFLKESDKKLIIIIDDIDRLDKSEIYSVFRLVKLTGDFNNTTYILSFDEDMVASAIGERFGEGNKNAGINFLEKIIQVPLKIPKAQLNALKNYCFEFIEAAMNSSNVELSEEDVMRFTKNFADNILIRLNTPRLAVRYGNTLSFSLSILKGEVNTVDLMLIEALKIFYPAHYNLVKYNPEYFINGYTDRYSYSGDEEKKKHIIEQINTVSETLSKKQQAAVKDLLIEMFPLLKSAYGNYGFSNESYIKWSQGKRIASHEYFDRYFSYAVVAGDLSDVEFESFIKSIHNSSLKEIETNIKDLIVSSSDDKLIQKLRSIEEQFDWETSKLLILAIVKNSTLFSNSNRTRFGPRIDPKSQAALFVYKLIRQHSVKDDQLEFAKELMMSDTDINFIYEINNWLRYESSTDEKIFTEEEYYDIFKIFLNKALNEAGDVPIFEKYEANPRIISHLIMTWSAVDREALNKYIYDIIEREPEKAFEFIKSQTPTFYSSHRPDPFKSSLREEEYQFIKRHLDVDYLYSKIKELYGDELEKEPAFWGDFDIEQTDINIARQYVFLYEKDHNSLSE